MGIGQRIRQIFRSRRNADEDVEALADRLDETYRSQLSHLQKVRRGVADVATSRKRVEVQLARLAQEAATLDAEAQAAVGRGDDDTARAALTRPAHIVRGWNTGLPAGGLAAKGEPSRH